MKQHVLLAGMLLWSIAVPSQVTTFVESFGEVTGVRTVQEHAINDGFSNGKILEYEGTCSIRSNGRGRSWNSYEGASGGAYAHLRAGETLIISGLAPNEQCLYLSIIFAVWKNKIHENGSNLRIEYRTTPDGPWLPAGLCLLPIDTRSANKWHLGTVTIPESPVVALRFTNIEAGNNGLFFNLDDLILTGIGLACSLPIELTDFTGAQVGNEVHLRWTVAAEHNNAWMAIERSPDGQAFTEISRVKGRGTVAEPFVYQSQDAQPLSGINYYRIRQEDWDGQVTYHAPIAVEVKLEHPGLRVYPAAAQSEVQLDLSQASDHNLEVQIFDLSGKLWQRRTWASGTTQQRLDVSQLPGGHYNILVNNNQQVYNARFVKF